METLAPPYLLIATPTLRDPNFEQTVVLMGHHDGDGALGWVINRVHEKPAREILTPDHRERIHAATPLHVGGPCPTDALLALFHGQQLDVESAELAPGLSVSRSSDVLPMLFARAPDGPLVRGRLIFGYAGWAPGQLEREMQEGAWLAMPNEEDLAFASQVKGLWRRCFDRLGVDPALLMTAPGRH